MTQAVPSSNYGRFIETLSWKWISFSTWREPSSAHKWRVERFASCLNMKEKVSIKRPWMGGVDVLRHFETRFILNKMIWWSALKWRGGRFASFWKMIHFKEKVSIKRLWMKGWTSCVILKNRFILNKKLMKRPEMKGRTVCVMLKNDSF